MIRQWLLLLLHCGSCFNSIPSSVPVSGRLFLFSMQQRGLLSSSPLSLDSCVLFSPSTQGAECDCVWLVFCSLVMTILWSRGLLRSFGLKLRIYYTFPFSFAVCEMTVCCRDRIVFSLSFSPLLNIRMITAMFEPFADNDNDFTRL